MRKIFALLVMSALSSSAFSMDEPEGWDKKKPEKKERRDPSIPPSPHPTPYPSLQPTPYPYEGDRFLSSSPPLSSSSMPVEEKERKEKKPVKSSQQRVSSYGSPPPPSRSSYAPSPSPYPRTNVGFGESQYYSPSSAYPNSNSSNSYDRYGYGYGESSMGGSYHSRSSHTKSYEEGGILGEELQNVLASLQIDPQIMSNPEAVVLTERYIAALHRGFRDGIWGRAPQKAHIAVETPKVVHSEKEDDTAQSILGLSTEVLSSYISELDQSGLEELAQEVLDALEKVSSEEQEYFRARFMPLVEKRLGELNS